MVEGAMRNNLALLAGLVAGLLLAPARADVAADIAAGAPVLEAVDRARAAGTTPAAVTRALIEAGQGPARAAFAVAAAWNECAATQAAVRVAAQAAEDEVEAVITTLANLPSCGCSAQSDWAESRLDGRLRAAGHISVPIELSDACSCVTAAVEAAVMAVPGKADRIVMAAVEAAQALSPALDSVGQRRRDDDRPFANVPGASDAAVFRRRPGACEADGDPLDRFDGRTTWERVAAGSYDDVGRFTTACERLGALVISEFNAEPEVGNYVEFFNGTDDVIDLGDRELRLAVFFAGLERPGQSVRLLGSVPPGGTYVVADTNAPDLVLRRADLIVPRLRFREGDALVLHAGWGAENCRCAEAVVAASLRAPAGSGERDPMQTELVHDKLVRIYGLLPGLVPAQVVDAIGQVDWNPRYTAGTALGQRWQRDPAQCTGDSNELDFAPWTGAIASDGTAFDDVGRHQASCRTAQIDLVLSELVAAEGDAGAIEIYNPTPADIDLGAGAYVVEVYRPGEAAPQQVIELRGNVEGDGSFLIASAGALPRLEAEADLVVNSLAGGDSAAVVLKKRNVSVPQACFQTVAAALEMQFGAGFSFVTPPGGSDSPNQPITPVVVDPIASPN